MGQIISTSISRNKAVSVNQTSSGVNGVFKVNIEKPSNVASESQTEAHFQSDAPYLSALSFKCSPLGLKQKAVVMVIKIRRDLFYARGPSVTNSSIGFHEGSSLNGLIEKPLWRQKKNIGVSNVNGTL